MIKRLYVPINVQLYYMYETNSDLQDL